MEKYGEWGQLVPLQMLKAQGQKECLSRGCDKAPPFICTITTSGLMPSPRYSALGPGEPFPQVWTPGTHGHSLAVFSLEQAAVGGDL